MNDSVNHPAHYTFGRYEVIDVIEDWGLDYHIGNAVKYLARAGRKDPAKELEDMEKAQWYLERAIAQRKVDPTEVHAREFVRKTGERGWVAMAANRVLCAGHVHSHAAYALACGRGTEESIDAEG